MIDDTNRQYLERRLAEERKRAEDAKDPKIAETHRELAGLYEQRLANGADDGTPTLPNS